MMPLKVSKNLNATGIAPLIIAASILGTVATLRADDHDPVDWRVPGVLQDRFGTIFTTGDFEVIQGLLSRKPEVDASPLREMSSEGFEEIFYNADLLKAITRKELILERILVREAVDLSNVKLEVPVLLRKCEFTHGLKIRNAQFVGLVLEECKLGSFEADGLKVDGDLVVGPRTQVDSEFRLPHSQIGGVLTVREGSRLSHGKHRDCSINLWDAQIRGEFHVGRSGPEVAATELNGCVVLNSASIGKLEFQNSILNRCSESGPEGFAVLGNDLNIRGSLSFIDRTRALGPLNFQGAAIGGGVWVDQLTITCLRNAFNLEGARVESSVDFQNLRVDDKETESALRLTRLHLKGDLTIQTSTLHTSWSSINAEGLVVGGRLLLKNNNFVGETSFAGSRLGSDVDIQSGAYSKGRRPRVQCLNFDNSDIARSVDFRRNMDDDRAKGPMLNGCVSFHTARIGGDLNFAGKRVDTEGNWWEGVVFEEAYLNLSNASASRIVFPNGTWPKDGLCMNGFTYESIGFDYEGSLSNHPQASGSSDSKRSQTKDLRNNACSLLKLATSRNRVFEPQPYEHMAAVMRDMGHQKVSRGILTAMSDNRLAFSDWNWGEWLWYRVFGRIIGYGYNPGRAFWLSVVWVFAASLVFWIARKKGWIEDVKMEKTATPPEVTRWTAAQVEKIRSERLEPEAKEYWMHALPYSIEKFTPFLSLGLAERWKPKEPHQKQKCRGAVAIQVFTWFHIVAGWILASLWVGALTGLAR